VNYFDPATGQESKVEKVQLKIEVVVDWPSNRWLLVEEEYNNLFQRAKHKDN
jgi:hypothetical protein